MVNAFSFIHQDITQIQAFIMQNKIFYKTTDSE